jgi:hypothetical protein
VRASTGGDDCVEVSPQEVAAATRATRAKKGKGAAALSNATTNRPADRFFLSRGQRGDQQTIKGVLQSKEAVDLIINKWFLDASIAFNASTSKYYQPMIDELLALVLVIKGQVCIECVARCCGRMLKALIFLLKAIENHGRRVLHYYG